MMRKILAGIAALLIILTVACKKSDPAVLGGGAGLITQIITKDTQQVGGYDTTYISYNADSTVHQIIATNSLVTITFYYTSGLIRRVESRGQYSATTDSIVLDDAERPAANYHVYGLGSFAFEEHYKYNSNNELTQTTIFFSNQQPEAFDSIFHQWSSGDMVSQNDPLGEYTSSYSYNTGIACMPGDVLYMASLLTNGLNRLPNAHLCTAINVGGAAASYTYTYDADNRITGYTLTQDGKSDTAFFAYMP